MHVVAIREFSKGFESRADALAAPLGIPPAVLIARLQAAGTGPVVVATTAEKGPAAALAAAVDAAGFRSLLLAPEDVETDAGRFVARKPSFNERLLRVESRGGEALAVDLPGVVLILRGTMGESRVETTTTRERKLSPARILLSGGLMLTKTVESTTRQVVEAREGFVQLYAPGSPPVALRESALTYEDFGLPRQPSRAANFAALAAELRRRCTAAVFDDRLLTRSGQARVLGPSLPPDEHVDVAISLLAAVLR